jgi:hypothetical protein
MNFGNLVMSTVPSNLANQVERRGTAIPAPLRHDLENKFSADLSDVRVFVSHVSTLVGAKSFTEGNNIHFAPGEYNPYSEGGQELIGHEAAHVIQQTQVLAAVQSADVVTAAAHAGQLAENASNL